MMTPREFGNYIAERRHRIGLTQKELADRLYVTDKAVSRWERGKGFPDIVTIKPLSEILGVSINDLLEEPKETLVIDDPFKISNDNPDNSINKIIKSYEKQRLGYQKRLRIKKVFIIVLVLAIFLGIMSYVCPWPDRVNQTLYGYREREDGSKQEVYIQIQGHVLLYLFKNPYLLGYIDIYDSKTDAKLFRRHFAGREQPYLNPWTGISGRLERGKSGYDYQGKIVADTEEEKEIERERHTASVLFCYLSFTASNDFSKIVIHQNDLFPGRIVASSDPDDDLEKVLLRLGGR